MLWILNFLSLFMCFPKCLRIKSLSMLYVRSLSTGALLHSHVRYPRYLKSDTCYIELPFITNFTLRMLFLHISIDFVFSFHFLFLSFMVSLHHFLLRYPQFLLFFQNEKQNSTFAQENGLVMKGHQRRHKCTGLIPRFEADFITD